ncbi:DUF418 domain-containing protein [Paenibacillus campinasensis]|nr:DUF418 domain-containing protein [Paenibacillus campinasensis]
MVKIPQRAAAVDAIRGLSLLGILLANMLIFQYGMYGKDELHLFHPTTTDTLGHRLVQVLVEGSFMPIFTFLFGYSMIKMRDALTARGRTSRWSFIRRSLALIGLGIGHGYYLWEGDILIFYGAITLLLLFFLKRKPRTLILWGALFLTLTGIVSLGAAEKNLEETQRLESYVTETTHVYQSGSYSEIMDYRLNSEPPLDLPEWVMLIVILIVPFMNAPMFLFGMAAAKKGRFLQPSAEATTYLRWSLLVPLGLVLKTAAVLLGSTHALSGVCIVLGGQLLALGYIHLFALLYAKAPSSSLAFRGFEAVGRMSLTNYLLQTVISTSIFYGYGLGQFGRLGVWPGILLALAIYMAQAAASLLWLEKFRSGPVERLMRSLTYWTWSGRIKPKLAKLRRAAEESRQAGRDAPSPTG